MDAEPVQLNQRDILVLGASGKNGIPNINRNRFPGWSELSCFQDSARSVSVKGSASCSLVDGRAEEVDGRRTLGPEVNVELGRGSIQNGVFRECGRGKADVGTSPG